MNFSTTGDNTGNGPVVHSVLAVIHNDNSSNIAFPDFISKKTALS